MIKTKEDLTGKRYGRLTVICQTEDHVSKSGVRKAQWMCRCDCGNEVPVIGTNLKRGNSTSCGCYQHEVQVKNMHRDDVEHHGDRFTRLYSIWTNMKTRTCNLGSVASEGYGRRGISICDDWKNSYLAFKKWAIENGYDDTLTIDRIDVDGDYCPENCRWANATDQANNRRSSVYVEHNNEIHSLSEWARILGYSASIFRSRAKIYNTTTEEQVHILASQANT